MRALLAGLVASTTLVGGVSSPRSATTLGMLDASATCNAWVLLHVYKSGGTTLRELAAKNWATPGHILPDDCDPDRNRVIPSAIDPDADVLFWGNDTSEGSLLQHAREHAEIGKPINIFIEHHSRPPHAVDGRAWRASKFCTEACSCVLHVNLRDAKQYYHSFIQASGPSRISPAGTWEELAKLWKEGSATVREKVVKRTADSFARELSAMCRYNDTLTNHVGNAGLSLANLTRCLGLGGNAAANDLAFDVIGRTDYLADAYAAVMGATGAEPVSSAREQLEATMRGAVTSTPEADGIAMAIGEIVDAAVEQATIDPQLFAAAFPKNERIVLRPGSSAATHYDSARARMTTLLGL